MVMTYFDKTHGTLYGYLYVHVHSVRFFQICIHDPCTVDLVQRMHI